MTRWNMKKKKKRKTNFASGIKGHLKGKLLFSASTCSNSRILPLNSFPPKKIPLIEGHKSSTHRQSTTHSASWRVSKTLYKLNYVLTSLPKSLLKYMLIICKDQISLI